MFKKEIIWREILYQAIEKNNKAATQKELAEKFKFSLSTVFHSLKTPRAIGALEVGKFGIRVRDQEKLITLWATIRKFNKDIVYKTFSPHTALETEKLMPGGVIWGAYSACRLRRPDAALTAGYDIVYVYAPSSILEEIKKRFPPSKKESNIIVLNPDPYMHAYGSLATIAQTLVDLWNLREWYADEFYRAIINTL